MKPKDRPKTGSIAAPSTCRTEAIHLPAGIACTILSRSRRHPLPPVPVRNPDIHPFEKRDFPRLIQPAKDSERQIDPTRKPGINHAKWHENAPHTLEEHLICGYEKNGQTITCLILGSQTPSGAIRYTGHVPFGEHPLDALIIASQEKHSHHPFHIHSFMSHAPATWLMPGLSCLIQCPEKTDCGYLIDPTYHGLMQPRLPAGTHPVIYH